VLIIFFLLLVSAYLVGSVTAAYFAVKLFRGTDIRKVGTGNVGSSNVASTTSWKLAIPVALFDMGKGMLMLWLSHLVGLTAWQQMAVGLMVIMGHNWSLYIGFNGGRGMITSLGIIAFVSPLLAVIVLVTVYAPAIKRQMALGVFVALVGLPALTWFGWSWIASSRFDADDRLAVTCGFAVMATVGIVKRLIGRRVKISQNTPIGELLLNRLLFDRDIRDRQAWINRVSAD